MDNNVINEGVIHVGFNGMTENHTDILNPLVLGYHLPIINDFMIFKAAEPPKKSTDINVKP